MKTGAQRLIDHESRQSHGDLVIFNQIGGKAQKIEQLKKQARREINYPKLQQHPPKLFDLKAEYDRKVRPRESVPPVPEPIAEVNERDEY